VYQSENVICPAIALCATKIKIMALLMLKIGYRTPTVTEYKDLRSLVGWRVINEDATDLALRIILPPMRVPGHS
jgi:hypothetical protein